jgi:hypothetical protein
MQCNAMQCNAMQCNAMQCNAMQCDAMRCDAMQRQTTVRHQYGDRPPPYCSSSGQLPDEDEDVTIWINTPDEQYKKAAAAAAKHRKSLLVQPKRPHTVAFGHVPQAVRSCAIVRVCACAIVRVRACACVCVRVRACACVRVRACVRARVRTCVRDCVPPPPLCCDVRLGAVAKVLFVRINIPVPQQQQPQ